MQTDELARLRAERDAMAQEDGEELDRLLEYARSTIGRRDVHNVYEVMDRLKAELAAAREDGARLDALVGHAWVIGTCDLRFHPKRYCVVQARWINSDESEETAIAYGDTPREAIDAALDAARQKEQANG